MPKRRATRRESDAQLKKVLNAIENERARERAAFRSMVAALRNATPIERAEGCLQFWAKEIAEWGDHEAAVYLISRGNDCSTIIRTIQTNWRQAVTDSVERFIAGDIIDQNLAQSVRESPTEFFSRFWGFFDSQELSIDATMLRAAKWCNIHGYEQWWRALERDLRGSAFSGGGHPFLLFNYSRADHAIGTMSEGLRLSLDAIETLSLPRSTPWWRNDANLGCAIHDAAAIIFTHARTRKDNKIPQLVERAVNDLRKFFDHQSGAWPACEPNRLSVESTAMALHALHAISVPDWNQFALPAKEYLWSQQHTDGYWFESSAPDPVWLTVLTLDAIELASGGTRLTFQLGLAPSTSPLVFVAYQHNDIKWLEDLKKHLGGLVYGGTIEFFDDRQIQPGEEWDPRIRQKLMDAKIIIPLISSNFMGSKYIQTVEFPTAMAQHGKGAVTVLPVLVEECDWQGLHSNGYFLSQIQMLPRDGRNNLKPLRAWGNKKHAALAQVAREVRQLVQRRK